MKNVFEEYRERLIKNNVDTLVLEIFETFVGTDYIDNSLDLVQILESKDYKEILKELKAIKNRIYKNETKKYTANEKSGYSNIVYGYILRVQSILNRERDVRQELIKESEELLAQKQLDLKMAEKWVKKCKRYIKQGYSIYSKEYRLLRFCDLTTNDYLLDDDTKVKLNEMLLKKTIQLSKEILINYL